MRLAIDHEPRVRNAQQSGPVPLFKGGWFPGILLASCLKRFFSLLREQASEQNIVTHRAIGTAGWIIGDPLAHGFDNVRSAVSFFGSSSRSVQSACNGLSK